MFDFRKGLGRFLPAALFDQARALADGLIKKAGSKVKYMLGTMIEVPRAALLADKIAGKKNPRVIAVEPTACPKMTTQCPIDTTLCAATLTTCSGQQTLRPFAVLLRVLCVKFEVK